MLALSGVLRLSLRESVSRLGKNGILEEGLGGATLGTTTRSPGCNPTTVHIRVPTRRSPIIHASIYIPSFNTNKQQKRSYAVSLDVQNLIMQSHPPSTIHSRPSPPRILSYLAPSSISQRRQWPCHGWGYPDNFRIFAVTELDEWVSDGGPLSGVSLCRMSIETVFFASHETRLACLFGCMNIHLK